MSARPAAESWAGEEEERRVDVWDVSAADSADRRCSCVVAKRGMEIGEGGMVGVAGGGVGGGGGGVEAGTGLGFCGRD